jgi:two-component system NtrC family sensor kinase
MVERGEPLHSAGTARRADGTRFPRETEASPVRIDDEDRYLVVVRDLTERQRLQTELVQAQKMETVGILVSGVAHELNNPIASIIGLSTLIGRDPGLSPDLRESAGLLVDEAQRAGQIVRTFLDFVRSRPPERHPTPIRPLLETVRELQSYSQKSGSIGSSRSKPGCPGSRSTARRSSRCCST